MLVLASTVVTVVIVIAVVVVVAVLFIALGPLSGAESRRDDAAADFGALGVEELDEDHTAAEVHDAEGIHGGVDAEARLDRENE
jgi:hypothetical protein